jgi:hypothetical protein
MSGEVAAGEVVGCGGGGVEEDEVTSADDTSLGAEPDGDDVGQEGQPCALVEHDVAGRVVLVAERQIAVETLCGARRKLAYHRWPA